MQRWVVVEVEHRIGFLGGTELLAVERLRDAGMETYWPHYQTTVRIGNRSWKDRKQVPVLRGLYPPWLFVAVDGPDPSDAIAKVKGTRYVADVLWTTADRHYLEPWFLDWLKSDQPHPDGKPGRPACLDPRAGLFEPPERTAALADFKPGDRVKTTGKWASFEELTGYRSIVESVNADGTVRVRHSQMLGQDQTETYDPLQVEGLS